MDFKEWYNEIMKNMANGLEIPNDILIKKGVGLGSSGEYAQKVLDQLQSDTELFKHLIFPKIYDHWLDQLDPIEQMFIDANQKIDRVIEAHYIWGMLKIKGSIWHHSGKYTLHQGRIIHQKNPSFRDIKPMSFNFEITDRFSERVKELRDAIAGMPKIDPVKMDKHFIDAKRYVGAGTVFSAKDIINPDYVFVDPRLNDNAEYIVIDDVGTDIESDFSRLKRSIKECGKMMIKPVEELFNAFFKKKGE